MTQASIYDDNPISFDELAARARRLEEEGRMLSFQEFVEAIEEAIEAVLGPAVDWYIEVEVLDCWLSLGVDSNLETATLESRHC